MTRSLRDKLTAERDAMAAQVGALTRDFEAIVEASTLVATDDEHDPEGATIAFERAQVAALLSSARSEVADLDLALARLDAGIYGTCERCGGRIADERLAALPGAARCVGCAAGAGTPFATRLPTSRDRR